MDIRINETKLKNEIEKQIGTHLDFKIGRNAQETTKNIESELKRRGIIPNMSEVRKLARRLH